MVLLVEQIVLVLFRIINFLVIIGLAIYAFKKYLLPTIREQIKAKDATIQGLQKTHRMYVRQNRTLDQGIHNDLLEQARLKEQLMRWRAGIDNERKLLEEKCEARISSIEKRLKDQSKRVEMYLVARSIYPLTFKKTRILLQKEFSETSNQDKFMEKVFSFMRSDQ